MAKLFEKLKLGPLELSNRIIIAPMCQYSSLDGKASSWHVMHLGSLSQSGAGLLILEATAVTADGRISWGDLGLYSDDCEIALRDVVRELAKYSSMPLAIQLAHAGRKASCEKPWLGGGQIAPDQPHGWQTVAPSEVAYNPEDLKPQSLTLGDLVELRKSFVDAAQRAARIGFAGIEVHSAHGYLLHQFLSPLSNQRSDIYGGSLENRMRFPLEVFRDLREALPASMALWARISATDWVDGGWTLDDSIVYSKELQKLGSAAIHVSTGGLDPRQKIALGPHYQVSFAEKIKAATGLPTIAVGLITEALAAEDLLQKNQADAVALARAILYDPRWPWHAAAQLGATVLSPPQFLRCQPRGLANLLKADSPSNSL